MFKVDLNSDLGESFGAYTMGMDEQVLDYVSSANIACGFHAGDPCVMAKTVYLAKKKNVSIGAHPSYPDLLGFGRRNMQITRQELENYVLYQLGALSAFARANGIELSHIKAHGALYNTACIDEKMSTSFCEALAKFDDKLVIVALSGSVMVDIAHKKGLNCANEVFADRAYNDDGTLVSRSIEGAIIEDENLAITRVIKMIKENKVSSINGKEISLKADSICVHGDNAKALEFVRKIRKALEKEGIKICSLKDRI